MYCNVVTAIDKIPMYLLRFNTPWLKNEGVLCLRRGHDRWAGHPESADEHWAQNRASWSIQPANFWVWKGGRKKEHWSYESDEEGGRRVGHIMMSHGLHESWQRRCRESFRIHGQLALADIGDSCYFLGSADVGQSQRFFSDISLNSKSRRKLDKYMRCNDWNIINETIRAQGLANAHI